jgi:hypothetical protein
LYDNIKSGENRMYDDIKKYLDSKYYYVDGNYIDHMEDKKEELK